MNSILNPITHIAIDNAFAKSSYDRTQCDKLLVALSGGRWITSRQAQQAGGFRYGSRIFDLRAMGIGIVTRPIPRKPGQKSTIYEYALQEVADKEAENAK